MPAAGRFVFLHGFTQTHHHWSRPAHLIAERVGGDPTLAFVDLPGHGLAGDASGGSIDTSGPALLAVGGVGTYVGYSMGGRMALVAALADAEHRIERLVLVGATAGLADDGERTARLASDDALADRVERIGVDAFLDEWLAGPLFAHLPPDPVGLAHRRRNTAEGLAHSLRRYGTGSMTPLWDRLGEIRVPVLVLAGEHDEKFTAISERLLAGLADAALRIVPSVGHAAHTEAPDVVAEIVRDWLG